MGSRSSTPEASTASPSSAPGSGDDLVETFAIDGAAIEDKPFRQLYQLIIGLLADAELPATDQVAMLEAAPEVRITYLMNSPPDSRMSAALVPYDRQFFAAIRDDTAEFMVFARPGDAPAGRSRRPRRRLTPVAQPIARRSMACSHYLSVGHTGAAPGGAPSGGLEMPSSASLRRR